MFLLLISSHTWASQQTTREKARQMAEAACLFQYEIIHSRFTLGFSAEKSIQISSHVLTEHMEKNNETVGDFFFSSIRKSAIEQLQKLEENKEATLRLKSPPSDFKDKFLSSCNEKKTEQLEEMHVFG